MGRPLVLPQSVAFAAALRANGFDEDMVRDIELAARWSCWTGADQNRAERARKDIEAWMASGHITIGPGLPAPPPLPGE